MNDDDPRIIRSFLPKAEAEAAIMSSKPNNSLRKMFDEKFAEESYLSLHPSQISENEKIANELASMHIPEMHITKSSIKSQTL